MSVPLRIAVLMLLALPLTAQQKPPDPKLPAASEPSDIDKRLEKMRGRDREIDRRLKEKAKEKQSAEAKQKH